MKIFCEWKHTLAVISQPAQRVIRVGVGCQNRAANTALLSPGRISHRWAKPQSLSLPLFLSLSVISTRFTHTLLDQALLDLFNNWVVVHWVLIPVICGGSMRWSRDGALVGAAMNTGVQGSSLVSAFVVSASTTFTSLWHYTLHTCSYSLVFHECLFLQVW